jgi:hypothetical protein
MCLTALLNRANTCPLSAVSISRSAADVGSKGLVLLRSQKYEKFTHEAAMSATFQMVTKMKNAIAKEEDEQQQEVEELLEMGDNHV